MHKDSGDNSGVSQSGTFGINANVVEAHGTVLPVRFRDQQPRFLDRL